MVGKKHVPPSCWIKLKRQNPFLPPHEIRKLYLENQRAKANKGAKVKKVAKAKKGAKAKRGVKQNLSIK